MTKLISFFAMHLYIFDQYLSQKKHETTVAKIETRLTDLGLNGKNCHVGPLKSLKSIVKEELKNNPKTIVVIGNNGTFNQLINAFPEEISIVLGIIPVGGNNSIARAFGIADEDQACNILAARLIETLSLGRINDQYFITSARIPNKETIIEINGKYTVEPAGPGEISVVNLDVNGSNPKIDPQDSLLEILVSVVKKGIISNSVDLSFIQTNRILANNLIHKNFVIDDSIEIKTPAEITAEREKINVIVGKERVF
jgi:hypothetical protein